MASFKLRSDRKLDALTCGFNFVSSTCFLRDFGIHGYARFHDKPAENGCKLGSFSFLPEYEFFHRALSPSQTC